MDQVLRTCTALGGLAFLVSISTTPVDASSLREEAYVYRAEGYEAQQRGDKQTALSMYQKAAQLDPSYAAPQNDIGVILEEQGRVEEAEQAYLQALRIDPNYLEAHANLALLYERLGNTDMAIAHWLQRYQQGDPDDPWTIRAEERLAALGVLASSPGPKGARYSKRHVVTEELEAHAQSLKDFHAMTEKHSDWP